MIMERTLAGWQVSGCLLTPEEDDLVPFVPQYSHLRCQEGGGGSPLVAVRLNFPAFEGTWWDRGET